MNTTVSISPTMDSWIVEEDLPATAALKVIRLNDPDYGLTDDEIQDRNEFIRCYLLSGYGLLLMIPRQTPENDFFIPDVDVSQEEYSAFNTMDFQKTLRPFDRYGYAIKKIMERVKDLAILHSSISSHSRKERTHQRYQSRLELEFRNRLLYLVDRYRNISDPDKRGVLKRKIGELNRRILDCKRTWSITLPLNPGTLEPFKVGVLLSRGTVKPCFFIKFSLFRT